MPYTLTDILSFMKQQAFAAGQLMRQHFQKDFQVFIKEDGSKVTSVDLAISRKVQQAITKAFPNLSLYSEESEHGEINPEKNYLIMDELDGTSYFVNGINGFSHQSAYYDTEQGLCLGLVYFPITDEMYFAQKGKGAFLQQKNHIIPLSSPIMPPFDLLRYGQPVRYKGKKYQWMLKDMIPNEQYLVPTTAYKTKQFVEGDLQVSIYAKPFMAPWDWAGDKVILEELGYQYGYINGEELLFEQQAPSDHLGYLICPKMYQATLTEQLQAVLSH